MIEVHNLHVHFQSHHDTTYAVRGVTFTLQEGEILGIVGESGCGKSAVAKAILGLLPKSATVTADYIHYKHYNLITCTDAQMRTIRGAHIGMIFQDPLSSLNPTMSIGKQIAEAIKLHHPKWNRVRIKNRVLELLTQVGIPDPASRYSSYPHEFSGGQRQRVMIAIALSCNPDILIADEPTTALDVTIQAQILDLLKTLCKGMSIILITHDLSIVANFCKRVLVMYAGEIIEQAPTSALFKNPSHPYTKALLNSLPRPGQPLKPIRGHPPRLSFDISLCTFCPRCDNALNICALQKPPLMQTDKDQQAACWLYDERNIHADQDQKSDVHIYAKT